MSEVKPMKFSSMDEYVLAQFDFLQAMNRELMEVGMAILNLKNELTEVKVSILNLKHQDKLSFNIKEAAEATGYGTDTLYSYVKQGIIPITQVMHGARIVISRDDLINFIISKKVKF